MISVGIALVIMLILLALSLPIGVAMGLGVIAALIYGDIPLALFTQKYYNSFDSFPLMAVPFFLLAGDIMQRGTLSATLLGWSKSMVGHKRAGLAHISVLTCLFYGALCGSAVATVAAVGGIMIPEMEREGYPTSFAAGLNAASGALGVMIPPSIPLILYGSFGGVSVSDLFMAGILPGCLIALMLMIAAGWLSGRHHYGIMHKKSPLSERIRTFKAALPGLGVPAIILGGIYGGFVTPTEAGVLAVVYALLIETFISKTMNFTLLVQICRGTMLALGMMFFIVIPANALGTLMQYYNIHLVLPELMHAVTSSASIFILLMIVLFLILGTFMDTAAAIMILAPILVPLAASYGINPVHFGIITLVTLSIGFITPPMGCNLFIACSIADINIIRLSRAVLPFILAMLIGVFIIAYVPAISLILVP